MEVLLDCGYGAEALSDLPLEDLARFVLEHEDVPAAAEVSISFVDNERMAQLNEAYRGKEGPTDVLSFECDGADDGFAAPEGFADAPFELGDVVIAPDVAARQAEELGHGFEAEVSLLIVHGLLHLCGYDHILDGDAERMEARERHLLGRWAEAGHDAVRGVRDDAARVRGEH